MSSRDPVGLALVVINGNPIGRALFLPSTRATPIPTFTLGRAHTCDLSLPDEGLAGVHALVMRDGADGWAIHSAHPDAHVFVNGVEVDGRHPLAPHDKLTFGTTAILKVVGDDEYQAPRILVDFGRGDVDPMTRVLNRRATSAALKRVYADVTASSGAPERALSVALVHLDRTKHINDVHGAMATDQALIAVARVVQQAARTSDVVGRYLGDGFVVAMPDVSLADAAAWCERVRAGVAQQRLEGFANDPRNPAHADGLAFTVSIGVSEWAPGDDRPSSMRALIAIADERLARAKRGGRDRVVSSS